MDELRAIILPDIESDDYELVRSKNLLLDDGGREVVLIRDTQALLPTCNPGAVPYCQMIDTDIYYVEANEVHRG